MSDSVRISQLQSVSALNDTDDFVIVQAGNTRRISLGSLTETTAPATGDEYLLIRSDAFQRITAENLPVRKFIGEFFFVGGNSIAPSIAFPGFCLTNFSDTTVLNATNYPDYVSWLRAQTLVYLDGLTGETTTFSASVTGSVITLDNNTANNDLLAALAEDQLAFGTFSGWRSVDVDGASFEITAIDTILRTITVTGSPTPGVQNITIYPHRIAGSTTAARLHSLRGRVLTGVGTTETISGLMRRSRTQGHHHQLFGGPAGQSLFASRINIDSSAVGTGLPNVPITSGGAAAINIAGNIVSDGVNGTPDFGQDTHGADMGAHIYQYVGRYQP